MRYVQNYATVKVWKTFNRNVPHFTCLHTVKDNYMLLLFDVQIKLYSERIIIELVSHSKFHSFEDLKNLHSATNHCHAAIIKDKRTYNSYLVFTNTRQLWKNINILLNRSSLPALPSYDSLSLLCLYDGCMVFTDGGVFYFSCAFFVICVFHTMFSSVI